MNTTGPILLAMGLSTLGAGPGPVDAPRKLADWYATAPPEGERWGQANNDSEHEWVVGLEGGEVVVGLQGQARPPSPLPFEVEHAADDYTFAGTVLAFRVDDGWIASFNKGEFGGSVWWFAPDGRRRYRISGENVEGFVPTKAGLLMLEGLCHMNAEKGSLRQLVRNPDGLWASVPFANLGDPPFVAARLGDDALLVVSNKRLARVDLATKRVEVLIDEAFWQSLYPTSIVVDPSGRVAIGMRRGVARLDKVGAAPKVEWLLPSKAVAEEKPTPGFH